MTGAAAARRALWCLSAAAGAALGCSDPNLPSKTTTVAAPAIACPAAPAPVQAPDGFAALVSFTTPVVSGGTPPVATKCTPASGTLFTLGSKTVTCTATDAVGRTASCAFLVTVTQPAPRLSVTNFLAFGDSITDGEIPDVTDTPTFVALTVHDDLAYPTKLKEMLSQRYTSQTITVVKDGLDGETAVAGAVRLGGELAQYRPDVLLLLEGVNDLNAGGAAAFQSALQALGSMILNARGRGVRVLVSTLLPQRAGLYRASTPELIAPFNAQLTTLAVASGAQVVDMYTDFLPHVTDWISPLDGLHPTAAGYQEMARVFASAIGGAFEVPPVLTVATARTNAAQIRRK
jgi:lysophospholipase L1-like esterase